MVKNDLQIIFVIVLVNAITLKLFININSIL